MASALRYHQTCHATPVTGKAYLRGAFTTGIVPCRMFLSSKKFRLSGSS